jgi:gentisate 1,2-dioxygenase
VNGVSEPMDEFYAALHGKNMDALWRGRVPGQSGSEPLAPYPPCRWEWSDIRPFMTRAGELVTPGPESERRVVQLIHPALRDLRSASHLLTANVQMVLPGEVAPPHRHTIAAIRFIIEGESAVTFVDGEAVEMHPGDLVLTPAQHWHGHENHSGGPTLWMDTLDRPLTIALRQSRFESYPAGASPMTSMRSGSGRAPYSYPWTVTEPELERRAAAGAIDPFEDVVLDYTNPLTGGHVLQTIGTRIQMLRPGVRTRAHRHAYTSVYHVFRGSGSTIADGIRIAWKSGDFVTLPPFCWHEHHNESSVPAYLFSVTDAPVVDALGFGREDPYELNGGHQAVIAAYAERFGEAVPAHA